jgi:type IV pilus assembly protein PilY1
MNKKEAFPAVGRTRPAARGTTERSSTMHTPRQFFRKALVGWLVYSMAFGPLSAYAASTDYSDVPLPAKKRPLPNLIMAIDDSGSMDFETSFNGNDGSLWFNTGDGRFHGRSNTVGDPLAPAPDNVVTACASSWGASTCLTGPTNFNTTGNPSSTWKKYVYVLPNGYNNTATSDLRSLSDGSDSHFAIPRTIQFGWVRSSSYNRQYYNPSITYSPWKAYNPPTGSACPSGTANGSGTSFRCNPDKANKNAARGHPVYPTSGAYTFNVEAQTPKNQNPNFRFRMYAGMIVPAGADYRICTSSGDGSGCTGGLGSWATAATNLCLYNSSGLPGGGAASCVGMGMTTGGGLDMSGRDHAEVAISYYPATYYLRDDTLATPDAYGPDGGRLRWVEIKPTTTFPSLAAGQFPKAATREDCVNAGYCTYAEEIQNFANWVQYYRKRTLSLNAALGNALDSVVALRGGYFVFNNSPSATYHTTASNTSVGVTMFDFDSTDTSKNDRRLLGHLYSVHPSGGTPTRVVLDRLGKQFMVTGSTAPVTAACQFNGGFVITDGFANPSGDPTWAGNYDAQPAGATPTPASQPTNYPYNTPYADPIVTSNTAPYKDNWSNTMADMAMYYYTRNLRPDLPAGKVPVNTADVNPDADRNPNIHMNLYGLVLGLPGRMFANPAFTAQTADPYANPPGWNALDPTAIQRDPSAIDELWHATINGRGSMLKADSPEETRNAVLDVVNQVVAKGGAAAAVAVSNSIPTADDNFIFVNGYNAGSWSGDLNAYTIDINTGLVSSTPAWAMSAQRQLADRDWTLRVLVTADQSASLTTNTGIPFQWANLNATTQQPALNGLVVGSTTIQGSWVVDWLHGDRSREGSLLRTRGPRRDPATGLWKNNVVPEGVSVLGDLVNAEPLYVREPRFKYFDDGYAAFKAAKAGRSRVLYAGGNDGILHVFDGKTGKELWGYTPSFAFAAPAGSGFTSAVLRNLADKEFFVHRFVVDATPTFGDVDLDKAGIAAGSGAPNWATMVVGGLGKGGRGYYAINATDPDLPAVTDAASRSAAEIAAAAKIMWEFPNKLTSAADKANIGYTYGRPIIAKTKGLGWVVLVASGYENGNETGGDGRGWLFVLHPADGSVLAKIPTVPTVTSTADGASGDADRRANPRGLAHIAAFAGSPQEDATIDFVYGGDLYGNVWRFDLTDPNPGLWAVTQLAKLVAGGQPQPVTTEPELGVVRNHRVVYVGTGRYFGDKDIPGASGAFPSATSTQSIYALKDDLTASPLVNVPGDLVQQTVAKSGTTASVTSNTVDFDTQKGWFINFPETGERIITNPTLVSGLLTFTSNIPDGSDPCIPGGRSWLWGLDYRSGSLIPGATYAGQFLGSALASRVVAARVGQGTRLYVRDTSGGLQVKPGDTFAPSVGAKRKAWREVLR